MCPDGMAIDMNVDMNSNEHHTCKAMFSLKVPHAACALTTSMLMLMLMQACSSSMLIHRVGPQPQ